MTLGRKQLPLFSTCPCYSEFNVKKNNNNKYWTSLILLSSAFAIFVQRHYQLAQNSLAQTVHILVATLHQSVPLSLTPTLTHKSISIQCTWFFTPTLPKLYSLPWNGSSISVNFPLKCIFPALWDEHLYSRINSWEIGLIPCNSGHLLKMQ